MQEIVPKDPLDIGEILFKALKEEFVFETAEWAIDRTERAYKRINRVRSENTEFSIHIPWLEVVTAFTSPGSHIFISRRLFERCRNDEMAAFVIAHEIAHHDLGHVKVFPDWLPRLTTKEAGILLQALYRVVEKRIYGPEQECDADRYAIELCRKAGYSTDLCIELFDVLENHALDVGDLNAVFGPQERDDELSGDADWGTKLRIWLYQRKRGYLPIRDRREMLKRHCEELDNQTLDSIGTSSAGPDRVS